MRRVINTALRILVLPLLIIAVYKPNVLASSEKITITPTPTLTPTPTPIVLSYPEDSPSLLMIPKITLFAPIIVSGSNQRGEMEVPPDDKTIGWWKHGAFPGEIGSSVLAGHFKIDSGNPGVFFNLSELIPGNEIYMVLKSGKVLTFLIESLNTYPIENFPLRNFFDSNDARRLNLITCAGKYVKDIDTYSDRLAVYAKLKE